MRYFFKLMLLAFCTVQAAAQTSSPEAVTPGGDYFSGPFFTNSYTIGEMAMVETFVTGSYMLTQGFQQPEDVVTGAPFVADDGSANVTLYPNPAHGTVTAGFITKGEGELNVRFFTSLGQVMEEKWLTVSDKADVKLDLMHIAAGVYLVEVDFISFSNNTANFHTVKKLTITDL
jgi:hypothetical protein